jgi:hypothetical protein
MTKLLLSLRLRGLLRSLRQKPLRSLLLLLLWLACLAGAAAIFQDIYTGFALLPPTEEAISLAPKDASTAYIIWRQMAFWAAVLLSMPSCYRVMRDLFHRPEWRSYAVLPIDPGAIYHEASLLGALFGFFWWSVAAMLAVPLFLVGDITGGLSVLLFVTLLFALLHLLAPVVHAFAGSISIDPESQKMLGPLSGAWVSPEATPFLYAPAAVLGGVGFGSIALQRTIEASIFKGSSDASMALLIAVGISLVLFVRGRKMYRESFAKVLPTLREAEALLYGGATIERGLPYGDFLSSVLPTEARPWLIKDLHALGRVARVRWLQLAAFVLAGILYLWRSVGVPEWFLFASCAACIWVGSVGLLLSEEPYAPQWLQRSLPVSGRAIILARATASLFFALHAGLPFSLVMYLKGAELSWLPLGVSLLAGFTGGSVSALSQRAPLVIYALFGALALAAGRLWPPLIALSLFGFALVAFLVAGQKATAPAPS